MRSNSKLRNSVFLRVGSESGRPLLNLTLPGCSHTSQSRPKCSPFRLRHGPETTKHVPLWRHDLTALQCPRRQDHLTPPNSRRGVLPRLVLCSFCLQLGPFALGLRLLLGPSTRSRVGCLGICVELCSDSGLSTP